MLDDHFILTTKDFSILEAMADDPRGRYQLLLPLIRRKIAKAVVVFREDLPDGIASINSRVSFRVNGSARDTRVLSTGQVTAPIGMFLSITTTRGLSLLGLTEGQDMALTDPNGLEDRILLEKVEYQPEASLRERRALNKATNALRQKPLLRIVSSGTGQARHKVPATPDATDDPGPSAA
ncbi:nucleoside-diphosphate kinase [Aliirhizobium cellulosilyticum]|uniref:Regulator of nucleoside diphosphate kinase n=1 Tax=Aliirhizobium cellulosilyticum TaxID=393664 RepID=A0A7W6WSV2_9HYPH|nr:nucleoside-diphosphate kinase [Rhizobium cellulosilyticum]MBB4351575.1 regulator of nucleoside diphosphate kinase [Rhizobium cellulosilyticum]MBB4414827.1 regulator of nucleoside diphosphate kinase [Rhizobium cellulosilyticum]MBB4449501.1 regulator of nucleoside diphosphate kinase [Rhizobium cellulosilyticum]